MKQFYADLSPRGIRRATPQGTTMLQTGNNPSLPLVKKLVTALIILLFAVSVRAGDPVHLPSPYYNYYYTNYVIRSNTLTQAQKDIENNIRFSYPNATLIDSADNSYNCHAYAWLNTNCWVESSGGVHDAPNVFWDSGYYVTTDECDAEIVVYGLGHSAKRITSSGWYESKWDAGPLMGHTLLDCPGCNTTPIFYRKQADSHGENCLPFSISGPNLVCSCGTTFSIGNLSAGYTANWTTTGAMTPASGQGASFTVYSNGSGTGNISVTISSPSPDKCPAVVDSRTVWAGPPASISSISLDPTEPGGAPLYVYLNYTYLYALPNPYDYDGATSYNWTCDPLSQVINYGRRCYITFYSPAWYTISFTASNSCGSVQRYTGVCASYGDYYYYSLSPNPASDNVTVTIKDKKSKAAPQTNFNGVLPDGTVQTMQASPVPEVKSDAPVTYTISIVNTFGTVFYAAKKTGDSFTIPVGNLKNGTYTIGISDGKTVSGQQLTIKH